MIRLCNLWLRDVCSKLGEKDIDEWKHYGYDFALGVVNIGRRV